MKSFILKRKLVRTEEVRVDAETWDAAKLALDGFMKIPHHPSEVLEGDGTIEYSYRS